MLIVLADLLTLAVANAISPLAIVAVILMATSGKGRTNGTAFILGSFTFAVALVGGIVLFGRSAGAEDVDSAPHITIDVIELVLGVAMIVLGILQWRKRSSHETPKWMDSIDGMNIWMAFLLGMLLAGPLSPKDLPLLIAAGGRISQASLATAEAVAVIVIFAALGLVAIAIPWILSVVAPGKVEQSLSGPRTWLVSNHSVIMTVLFVILGTKLIGSAVTDLLG